MHALRQTKELVGGKGPWSIKLEVDCRLYFSVINTNYYSKGHVSETHRTHKEKMKVAYQTI